MAKTRGVWIADESPQGDAWRKYLRASGKGMPFMTDSALHKGRGYYRPSEWPPGYEARPSAAPIDRMMRPALTAAPTPARR